MCESCLDHGLVVVATVAHHHAERLDRPGLALDPDNLRALCNPCHTSLHNLKRSTP